MGLSIRSTYTRASRLKPEVVLRPPLAALVQILRLCTGLNFWAADSFVCVTLGLRIDGVKATSTSGLTTVC